LIVLDTSFLLALLDGADAAHRRAAAWYAAAEAETFVTSPLVLAELDYLLRGRGTPAAVEAFLAEVRAGSLGVEWWSGLDAEAAEVAERHAGLDLGLTDASLVALAGRFETDRIATFDERHFRAVEPLAGGASFVLLPADAPG
jgi:predicted nucleic acid-binding protein